MVIYINIDNSGYVDGWGTDDGDVRVELSSGHEFFTTDIQSWKYENDELVLDDARNNERIAERQKEESKISKDEINEMAILELASIVSSMKGGL